MAKESTKWWIGTFPSWIVTALLAGILWFARETYQDMKKKFEKYDNAIYEQILPRIGKVETTVDNVSRSVEKIERKLF